MSTTKKLVIASMLAALVCVATMVIKIPSPMKGYINLGDCIVLLSAWLLPPTYGFLAAGLGSALADVFLGYLVYAPATFVIKGVMALIAYFAYRLLCKKIGSFTSRVISGAIAELWMIIGYFLFEGLLYGFAPSLVNIPANAVQGAMGLFIGTVLINLIGKTHISPIN